MKFNHLLTKCKKKAVSPVIAAVLLIGLVVMGSAVLMFIFIPLMNPAAEFEITSAFLFYDNDRTIVYRHGVAELRFSLQQVGTTQVEITEVKLHYAQTGVIQDGTEIELIEENGDGAWIVSMQPSVTTTTSQEITTTGTTFVMRFRLPDVSENIALDYKIEVLQANGQSETTSFGDEDMNLGADAPRVVFSLDQYLRRVVPLSASATDTHGGIANVTYSIYNVTMDEIHSETVDSQPFSWNWNTRDPDYPNGDYTVEVVAKDYAGWDDTNTSLVEVDNDYTKPTILSSLITSPYTNQTGERGEPVVIEANVTDTGYLHFDPVVAAVYLHYQLTGAEEQPRQAMNLVSGNDTWGTYQFSIPSSFVDHEAIINNITYYIEAIDSVGNMSYNPPQNNGKIIQVADHFAPNFGHTPVETANEKANVQIITDVTDKDIPASQVSLYYRTSDDTVFTTEPTGIWQKVEMTNTEDFEFTGTILYSNVTFDGIDYFMNGTDAYNNTRYDGTPDIPHHINVVDITLPAITHVTRSSVIEDTNLILTAQVADNDPAFYYNESIHNGTVELHYRLSGSGGYSLLFMTYVAGADPFWEAIVEYDGNYSYGSYGIDYYITATDASGNTGYSGASTEPNHVEVELTGSSSIDISSTVTLSTSELITDNTIEFEITNSGSSDATITHFAATIYNGTGPDLYEVYINDALKWGPGAATNGTEVDIDDYSLLQGNSADIKLVFSARVANKTLGGIFYDLDFLLDSGAQHEVIKVKIQKNYGLNVLSAVWDRTDRIDFNLQSMGDSMIIIKMKVVFDSTREVDRFRAGGDEMWRGRAVSDEWFVLDTVYNFVAASDTFRMEFTRDVTGAAPFYITFETADGYIIALTPITPT